MLVVARRAADVRLVNKFNPFHLILSSCSAAVKTGQPLCSAFSGGSESCQASGLDAMMSAIHTKCRFPNDYIYKTKDGAARRIVRFEVSDDLVPWTTKLDNYDPVFFEAHHLEDAPWADPALGKSDFDPKFNQIDGKIDRKSHEGKYKVVDGWPLNIRGRTGLRGRGVLGRYGPNHAADPIVTRWSRNPESGEIEVNCNSGKQILEFVAIKRKDTGEWAIPGGMVDPGENVSVTVRREFMEEALDSGGLESSPEKLEELEKQVKEFFEGGKAVYQGYVDDPRNSDNAWMETVAFHFHDETGDKIGKFDLKAGDDAKDLKWMQLSDELQLYASHKLFLNKVASLLDAHW